MSLLKWDHYSDQADLEEATGVLQVFTERGHEASHCGDQLLHCVQLYLPSSSTATVTFSLQCTHSPV